MKRSLLTVGLIALLSLPHTARAFGWKDVIAMHQDGVADSLIIQKIEHSGKSFDLSPKQIHALMEADVSDQVISAMLATEDRDDRDYDDDRYSYDHPRAYVGFGFHYYDGWPYDSWPYYVYRAPRYYGGYYRRYDAGYPRYYRYPTGPNYGTQRQRTYVTPRSGWNGGPGAAPRAGTRTRTR